MKKIMAFIFCLFAVASISQATTSPESVSSSEQNISFEITVDASPTTSETYNYEATKHTRQLPHNYEVPIRVPQAYHNSDPLSPFYGMVDSNEIVGIKRVFSWQTLINIVGQTEVNASVKNFHGIELPTNLQTGSRKIRLITAIPKGKILIPLGEQAAKSKNWFDDTWKLMAFESIEAIKMGADTIYIYEEGAKRLMVTSSFGLGLGTSRLSTSNSEAFGNTVNAGFTYGRAKANYDHDPWLRSANGRLYDLSLVYEAWLGYYETYCPDDSYQSVQMSSELPAGEFDSQIDFFLLRNFIDELYFDNKCSEPLIFGGLGNKQELVKKVFTSEKSFSTNIFFDFDKSKIKANQKENIDKQAQFVLGEWNDLKANQAILVAGACSPEGSREYNDVLGMNRALAVRSIIEQRLLAIGVPKDVIAQKLVAVSKSELSPFFTTAEEQRSVALILGYYQQED